MDKINCQNWAHMTQDEDKQIKNTTQKTKNDWQHGPRQKPELNPDVREG